MAVLTGTELARISEKASRVVTVNYTKPQVKIAIQAIEDWYEANKGSLSNAVDAATSPVSLTAGQKKRLVAFWLEYKFAKELE